MAKKNNTTVPIRRTHIACPYYVGYLDEMPEELKLKLKTTKKI